jgi:hypothetical protein
MVATHAINSKRGHADFISSKKQKPGALREPRANEE